MKKIVKIIILIGIIELGIDSVQAANYNIKELIPVNTETTIVTDHFSYRDFYYDGNKLDGDTSKNNYVIFKSIKNISKEELPVTISIGLFDKNKKNIGTINYCSTSDKKSVVAGSKLKPEEEIPYAIEINKKSLQDGKKVKDIKYISILNENKNCRIDGSQDYVGQKIEEIGMAKNNTLDSYSELLIKILAVIGIVLLSIFVYRFLFTRSFENFDGEDVRKGYQKWNKEQQIKREEELRRKPPQPKEIKKVKTDEVIQQEIEMAKKENKEQTDLHNLYK